MGYLIAFALIFISACRGSGQRSPEAAAEAATLAMRRGDLAAAGTLIDQVPPEQRALARVELLLRKHDLPAARAALAQSPSGSEDLPRQARRTFLQGWLKLLESEPGEALHDLDEASRTSDPDVSRDAAVLAGVAEFQLHKATAAFSRLDGVRAVAAASGDLYHEAAALLNIGFGELSQKRYDAALPWFEQVLAIMSLSDFTIYADALNDAGICYSRLGQFDRAVATQQRAIALHDRGSRREYEQALGQLGATYLLQDDVRAALPFLDRARDVAAAADLPSDAALWAGNLAAGYIEIQNWDAAARFNDEARRLKTLAGSRTLVYNTLNAAQIASGRGQVEEAVRLYSDAIAADAEPSIRWNAEAGLAKLDMARQRPADAARHFQAALDIIEQTRSDLLKTDYKLSFLTELITFYRSYVDALVSQQNIGRALEVADSSRARILAERQGAVSSTRMTASSLERRAGELHAVFLSYWLAPGRSYLWIVTGAGTTLSTLPPDAEIGRLVTRYRAVLDNAMADPLTSAESDGERLYHVLLEPAAAALAGAERVIIVPDGALYGLNFETLPVAGTRRHYWIEDAVVEIAPSLALVDARAASEPPKRSLLLIGDPDASDPTFPRLHYAAAEMSAVARSFSSAQVVSYGGAQASPAAYRDAHPERFAFVHFSAHATTNVESPLDSAVILSGPAGASKLYARDVAEETLRAELVTVSACRSAGGRTYSGEGLVGFAWAFLRAGARRVVAGLWDVDDRSTADLMGRFYANVAAGRDPADALHGAKLSVLSAGGRAAVPYYWAPFELFTATP